MMMKKWITAFASTMLSMMLFAGIASAHVVVRGIPERNDARYV